MLAAAPTTAFADVFSPEPPDGWSRPSEGIDEERDREAELLMDGPTSRVEESNRDVDSDVLDSAVRLGIVYPAAL